MARQLKQRLTPEEPIFIDAESVRGGSGFLRQIGDAVDSALGYVILVSKDFNSDWALEELARAKKQHKQRGAPICPVYVDGPSGPNIEPPYGLASFQSIDGRDVDNTAHVLGRVFSNLPR